MSKVVHADQYDTIKAWCGAEDHDDNWDDNCVHDREWHESPTALDRVTCVECLNAIYTLGQWAANALSRIPRHNHPPAGASVDYTSALASVASYEPCPVEGCKR